MMVDSNAAVTLLEERPEKLFRLWTFNSLKPFFRSLSKSVTSASASIMTSTFNCYCWTSITTLCSIKIQCRTSPTAEEQNLHNLPVDIENQIISVIQIPLGTLLWYQTSRREAIFLAEQGCSKKDLKRRPLKLSFKRSNTIT